MAESGIGAPSYLNDTEPTAAYKLPTFIDEQPEEAQKIANQFILSLNTRNQKGRQHLLDTLYSHKIITNIWTRGKLPTVSW